MSPLKHFKNIHNSFSSFSNNINLILQQEKNTATIPQIQSKLQLKHKNKNQLTFPKNKKIILTKQQNKHIPRITTHAGIQE